jgi:hypothetical protein
MSRSDSSVLLGKSGYPGPLRVSHAHPEVSTGGHKKPRLDHEDSYWWRRALRRGALCGGTSPDFRTRHFRRADDASRVAQEPVGHYGTRPGADQRILWVRSSAAMRCRQRGDERRSPDPHRGCLSVSTHRGHRIARRRFNDSKARSTDSELPGEVRAKCITGREQRLQRRDLVPALQRVEVTLHA